mgnify:CR=1 FL=1
MAQIHSSRAKPRNARRLVAAAIAVAARATAVSAFGATTPPEAIALGSYSSAGLRSTYDARSYVTGNIAPNGNERRGFLAFDLRLLGNIQVTSAVLRVENTLSLDADLSVYGVPFADPGNFGRLDTAEKYEANFHFIGSDSTPLFAQSRLPDSDRSSFVELALNDAALQAINANRDDDYYAFGLRVSLADVQSKPPQFAFGAGSSLLTGQRAQLIVGHAALVPETASAWLLLPGLLLVALASRRREMRARQ